MGSPTHLLTAFMACCTLLSTLEASRDRIFSPVIQSSGSVNSMNNMVFTGGSSSSFYVSNMNFGSVYKVTIQQRRLRGGKCEEKVTIGLQESSEERTFNTACLAQGGMRSVKNEGDILVIGSPEDNFFVFTSNRSVIIYQQSGKWKKGEITGSYSSEDKDLTAAEVDQVKQRVKNWQEFLNKNTEVTTKYREMKKAELNRYKEERRTLYKQKKEEVLTHVKNIRKLVVLRNEEYKKHRVERANIYRKARKEGMTEALKQLLEKEEERHNGRIEELDDMVEKENERYEVALNDYEEKLQEAENKSEEEINRIEALEEKEEKKKLEQIQENIKQGW